MVSTNFLRGRIQLVMPSVVASRSCIIDLLVVEGMAVAFSLRDFVIEMMKPFWDDDMV